MTSVCSDRCGADDLLQQLAELSIDAGADFIKTSTGKVPVNATLESARIMMEVIKAKDPKVGFKPATPQ